MYQYPDYLAHYGTKGMKWGHRRAARYSAGVTKSGKRVSNRKAKKQILKGINKPGLHQVQIASQMQKEYSGSKEAKALLKKSFTEEELTAATKKYQQLAEKYIEPSAKALLKDVGYDDTKAGVDFTKKLLETN